MAERTDPVIVVRQCRFAPRGPFASPCRLTKQRDISWMRARIKHIDRASKGEKKENNNYKKKKARMSFIFPKPQGESITIPTQLRGLARHPLVPR